MEKKYKIYINNSALQGAPLAALPVRSIAPSFNDGTSDSPTKNPVYYFGVSLNNAIFAGEWNDKAYSELCLILKYIEDETVCYERLREERFGGKTENDKIRRSVVFLLGGSRSTSAAFRASGKGVPSSPVDGDAGIVRAFAEYRYCWHDKAIDYIRRFGAKFHAKGKEARVYLSKDESFVYKIKNDVSNDLLKFFDEIINHNILFPATEYVILGFGLDERGRFCAILKQDAVKGRPATLKEIEKHFLERGFEKISDFAYKKGDYIVSDLKPSNVVYSKGKCFVIDCFAQTLFDFDNNFYINNSTLQGIFNNAPLQSPALGELIYQDFINQNISLEDARKLQAKINAEYKKYKDHPTKSNTYFTRSVAIKANIDHLQSAVSPLLLAELRLAALHLGAHLGATNLEMQSAELDIVLQARAIAQNGESLRQRFDSLVELYDNQRTIRPTDTKSKLLQQYSTPCPLAFLASEYVKQYGKDCQYFEPSAGNGMLTISLPQNAVWVNELDEVRFENLKKQGYLVCSNQDATKKILPEHFPADGIITNPPFASLPKDEQITVNGFTLATLDYKMAYIALEQMKDYGRAAVIVGGKMFDNYWKPLKNTDKKVLFGQWKVFLGWLYAAYNVEDLIYIGGDYIYRKQGTTYPVVLILINGRRVPFSTEHKPDYIYDPLKNEIVTTYDQLFTRVAPTIQHHTPDASVPSITPSFNDGNAPISPLLTKELELAKLFYKQKDNFLFYAHNDKIFIQPTKNPKGARSGFWLPFAKYDGDDQTLSQTEILKQGISFFNQCYPNGIVDVFLLSFKDGIGASKLYKKSSYRDYEYVMLDDRRDRFDLAVTNPAEYIALVQKGREMLYGGTFTGKKSTSRTGKDHLDGKDATEKMLQEQFGFKSVVHQVKITQKDYQALMNNTYNAFMDLAEICGIKNPKVLAHKSTLSLNLAAKASGNAYAYYSPKYLSLNLTRKEGSGTLAHEWFHSLDHWLGTMYGYRTNEYGYKYLTNDTFGQQYPNKALYKAVRHWVLVMEEQLSMYEKSKAADKRKKRKYWSKPIEMAARCFECYCLKKLAEKGLKNDFLVEDRLDSSVYPSPEDEAKVIKCFDDLFAALNEYSQDGENFLYGSSPEIPEIENTVSSELIAQIPATEDDRRKFLTSELQRFEGTEIYSKYFNQNVIVLKKSLSEITKWAAKSKESVIAALNLDGVVANATKVNEDNPKPNKKTKEFYFNKMYEMRCNIKGVGTAKLMVGERKNGKKITYCITALRI